MVIGVKHKNQGWDWRKCARKQRISSRDSDVMDDDQNDVQRMIDTIFKTSIRIEQSSSSTAGCRSGMDTLCYDYQAGGIRESAFAGHGVCVSASSCWFSVGQLASTCSDQEDLASKQATHSIHFQRNNQDSLHPFDRRRRTPLAHFSSRSRRWCTWRSSSKMVSSPSCTAFQRPNSRSRWRRRILNISLQKAAWMPMATHANHCHQ